VDVFAAGDTLESVETAARELSGRLKR
jgi:hypothetical protein